MRKTTKVLGLVACLIMIVCAFAGLNASAATNGQTSTILWSYNSDFSNAQAFNVSYNSDINAWNGTMTTSINRSQQYVYVQVPYEPQAGVAYFGIQVITDYETFCLPNAAYDGSGILTFRVPITLMKYKSSIPDATLDGCIGIAKCDSTGHDIETWGFGYAGANGVGFAGGTEYGHLFGTYYTANQDSKLYVDPDGDMHGTGIWNGSPVPMPSEDGSQWLGRMNLWRNVDADGNYLNIYRITGQSVDVKVLSNGSIINPEDGRVYNKLQTGGVYYNGRYYNGSVTLDTRSYVMAPRNIYDIGVKFQGTTRPMKVYSSRDGIATVTRLSNGNYRIRGVSPGVTYIICEIYNNDGSLITHASIKVTVQYGVRQHGEATRATSYFN